MNDEQQHGQQTEFTVKSTGPSGWESPENVKHIVDKISETAHAHYATTQTTVDAAKVMQHRIVYLAGLVTAGVVTVSIIDVSMGGVLIPLISFAGGIGLGSVRPRQ